MGNNPIANVDPDGGQNCGGPGEPPCIKTEQLPEVTINAGFFKRMFSSFLGLFDFSSRDDNGELTNGQREQIDKNRNAVIDAQMRIITEYAEDVGDAYGTGEIVRLASGDEAYDIFNEYGTRSYSKSNDVKWAGASLLISRVPGGKLLKKTVIRFGKRGTNQIHHALRHVLDAGLDANSVKSAVRRDIQKNAHLLKNIGDNVRRIVTVNGVDIEYRAFKLADEIINVGTMFPTN